jgi:hypothetical protein
MILTVAPIQNDKWFPVMTTNAEPLFERLETSIISDKLFSTFGIVQSCVFSLTIVSFSLLVYVVFLHSPKRIGSYKWWVFGFFLLKNFLNFLLSLKFQFFSRWNRNFRYILINATFGFAFQTISVAFRCVFGASRVLIFKCF